MDFFVHRAVPARLSGQSGPLFILFLQRLRTSRSGLNPSVSIEALEAENPSTLAGEALPWNKMGQRGERAFSSWMTIFANTKQRNHVSDSECNALTLLRLARQCSRWSRGSTCARMARRAGQHRDKRPKTLVSWFRNHVQGSGGVSEAVNTSTWWGGRLLPTKTKMRYISYMNIMFFKIVSLITVYTCLMKPPNHMYMTNRFCMASPCPSWAVFPLQR